MLKGYFTQGMDETAVFEFFVRTLPRERNFLLAAGLDQALTFLEEFRFLDTELEWLERVQHVQGKFLQRLAGLRFTGDVDAIPEGTVFFANEPILRVIAPLPQAQLMETRLINILHYQTVIASKAARCVLAAQGKTLVDFGLRRAHGAEAGLFSARASYLAGFDGTSTVQAKELFDIPLFGTMAHSYVQAHASERDAFRNFAYANPENAIFLLDTYDTEHAAMVVVELAPELQKHGIPVKGIRLDSGDLAYHAQEVRRILDHGGLTRTKIYATGNLDEYALEKLTGTPIDGFGVGTRMNTSADRSYLDCAYKLQEYAGKPRRKRSEGKATWPGRKQVFRQIDETGRISSDILTCENDSQEGTPLLGPAMRSGRRVPGLPSLEEARQHAAEQLRTLPSRLRALAPAEPYPVIVSTALRELAAEMEHTTPALLTH